jgi:DNA-binding transcriptional ArsR family regulator
MKKAIGDKTLQLSGNANGNELILDYSMLRKAVLNTRAIDHEFRKKIISMLLERESMTVTDVYQALNLEQSVASQHLAILRRAGVVKTDRNGKFIQYSLNTDRLQEINIFINNLAS